MSHQSSILCLIAHTDSARPGVQRRELEDYGQKENNLDIFIEIKADLSMPNLTIHCNNLRELSQHFVRC